nr:immunoglobulin heavy chain junction region [Mus musculus]
CARRAYGSSLYYAMDYW